MTYEMEYKPIDSDLTDSQRSTIIDFRSAIDKEELDKKDDPNAIGTDDLTLIRFLKARNFNLNQALTMYRNCIHWRQTVLGVGMDALYTRTDPWNYPEREFVFTKWPMWFHKTDKLGRPINIQTFGAVDIPALHQSVSPDRHWETVVVNAESMMREVLPAASKQAGRPIKNAIAIIDLKGFGLTQFWGMKSLVRSSFQISQDYYPETMGRLLVINAPSSFTVIWGAVKPWLAKETVAKIDILGSDYKKELLEVIDEENLPAKFGGKCECVGGCEVSNAGPWMDERKRRDREMNGHGNGNGMPNGRRISIEAAERAE